MMTSPAGSSVSQPPPRTHAKKLVKWPIGSSAGGRLGPGTNGPVPLRPRRESEELDAGEDEECEEDRLDEPAARDQIADSRGSRALWGSSVDGSRVVVVLGRRDVRHWCSPFDSKCGCRPRTRQGIILSKAYAQVRGRKPFVPEVVMVIAPRCSGTRSTPSPSACSNPVAPRWSRRAWHRASVSENWACVCRRRSRSKTPPSATGTPSCSSAVRVRRCTSMTRPRTVSPRERPAAAGVLVGNLHRAVDPCARRTAFGCSRHGVSVAGSGPHRSRSGLDRCVRRRSTGASSRATGPRRQSSSARRSVISSACRETDKSCPWGRRTFKGAHVNFYRCRICGETYLGTKPPSRCPFCGVTDDFFVLTDRLRRERDAPLPFRDRDGRRLARHRPGARQRALLSRARRPRREPEARQRVQAARERRGRALLGVLQARRRREARRPAWSPAMVAGRGATTSRSPSPANCARRTSTPRPLGEHATPRWSRSSSPSEP